MTKWQKYGLDIYSFDYQILLTGVPFKKARKKSKKRVHN